MTNAELRARMLLINDTITRLTVLAEHMNEKVVAQEARIAALEKLAVPSHYAAYQTCPLCGNSVSAEDPMTHRPDCKYYSIKGW